MNKSATTLTLSKLSLALTVCAEPAAERRDALASSEQGLAASGLDLSVQVRGSGSARIHLTVYEGGATGARSTLLAIPGLTHTAAGYVPLVEQIFATPGVRQHLKRFIAIDLVGHGASSLPHGLPDGLRYGDLTIDDNVDVFLQCLIQLRAHRLAPQIIVGHSAGGLLVQAAQEALLRRHTSLADHGVRAAVLLAPVPPTGRPWTLPSSLDLAPALQSDAKLGSYLDLTPEAWIGFAFATTQGVITANAPGPREVLANGYAAIEPLALTLQLVESPGSSSSRPSVRAGAFAPSHGTSLRVVSFSEDTLVPASDLRDLAAYLSPDESVYLPIQQEGAVHAMHISDPAGLIATLRNLH